MQSLLKPLAIAGAAALILGCALRFGARPEMPRPPSLAERSSNRPPALAERASPSPDDLSGPWYKTPRLPPRQAPKAPASAPLPAEPPPRVDKSSLSYLGSYKDKGGSTAYFFKYLPSGQVVVLKPGETVKGWTLKTISEKAFTLSGSGGLYEVPR